ncbi:MAG: hypothetical protein AB7F09_15835 [Parvibaculaceae bacterium]
MAKSRFKRKGKTKFVMIEGYIMRSPAWAALTPNDRAAYLELKWRYDGVNNGRIGLGCRELAKALQSSKNTAHRSLEKLIQTGFLAKGKPSGFNVKNRVSTEWRLTEYGCDVSGQMATKDFMRWQPEEKTQSHHRYAQSHQRDNDQSERGENRAHSPTTGTVTPNSAVSQSHQEYTYRYTMGGSPEYPATSPTEARAKRAPQSAVAKPARLTSHKSSLPAASQLDGNPSKQILARATAKNGAPR